jgi:hypothetical protein
MILLRIVDGTGLDSWMVRQVTRGWATHSEFVNTDNRTAFGAYLSGVGSRPMGYAKFKRVEYYTAPGIDQAYEWARTQAGKKYDYSAIFGIFLDRNWRDENRFFCSELTTLAFEKAGCPILNPAAPVYRITPRDQLLSLAITKVDYLI